jgi:hypothetical protein
MQKQLVLVDMLCRTATVFQASDDEEKRYGHFQKDPATVHRIERLAKC